MTKPNYTLKTQDQRIVDWNEERLLIKEPSDLDMMNEMSFILEEVIEGLTPTKSDNAREQALVLVKIIAGGYLEECLDRLEPELIPDVQPPKLTQENLENFVDALGDIKVFATGGIRKAGYNPDLVMHEVLQEIESRVGSIQNGKFTKDKSPEAQKKWYKADFTNAKV